MPVRHCRRVWTAIVGLGALARSPALPQAFPDVASVDVRACDRAPERCAAFDALDGLIAARSAAEPRALQAEIGRIDTADPAGRLARVDAVLGLPTGTAARPASGHSPDSLTVSARRDFCGSPARDGMPPATVPSRHHGPERIGTRATG
jgi:hypothetical protein